MAPILSRTFFRGVASRCNLTFKENNHHDRWEGLLLLRRNLSFSSGSWSSPKDNFACWKKSGACLWSQPNPSSPSWNASLRRFHTWSSVDVHQVASPYNCIIARPCAVSWQPRKKRTKSAAEIKSNAQLPADLLKAKAVCFSSIDASSSTSCSQTQDTMRSATWMLRGSHNSTDHGRFKWHKMALGSFQA